MSLRDERQKEFAQVWFDHKMRGILHLCPRFGKIYVAINILEKLPADIKVLIAYPDRKIKDSWLADFNTRKYENPNVTFTTFKSLHKHANEKYEMFIIDEIHMLSDAQICSAQGVMHYVRKVLGLSGTISSWTKRVLEQDLKLKIIANYTIEKAIEEGVLPDYEITVITVPLDDKVIRDFGKKKMTEKQRMKSLMYYINKEDGDRDPSFFLRLKAIEVFSTSIAKRNEVMSLLSEFKDERLMVFCGRTNEADNLGIESYHTKGKKETFEKFMIGEIDQLALVKMGNVGVTYTPLSKVIISSFDSNSETLTQKINRAMSLEYSNPNKKAVIYIVSSDEKLELKWLNKALKMFDESKIKFL